MARAEDLATVWRSRLQADLPKQDEATRESIVAWLLGDDVAHLEQLAPEQLEVAQRAMDYRYRILRQRYLDASADQAYRRLIQRLSSLFLIRNKVRTWIALSRDRQRSVQEVLQEVIQEMLLSDRHLRRQVAWVRQCTDSPRLRNVLMLTTTEEYCLRPIRNQPLLVYRFVNYLRRSQRGGLTQIPSGDLIRLVSEEVSTDETDNTVSLLDNQAIADYQEQQFWEEQQAARSQIKQSFLTYLAEKVDPMAGQWLELHLQGYSQDVIAQKLDMPVQQAYRLREKVSYHAIRVFTLKDHPKLVMSWLGTSLKEHHFGLTPTQWEQFWQDLTPEEQTLLEKLLAGQSLESIAQESKTRVSQVMGEWSKLYLAAQSLRNDSKSA